jgi:hypothetical protein
MSNMNRNEFLKWVGGSALLALAACGDDGGSSPPVIDAPMSNFTVVIGDNHAHAPHAMVVSMDDVTAAVDKTYMIKGNANHDHAVVITAAQFAMLAVKGTMVMSPSTVDTATGHMHEITVTAK